jgi:GR25 family glycosyltransferase involved in LPS biosynthesis
MSFNTPILLIAWRRPNHLKQVIAALKKVNPKYIYAAVDGPRIGLEFEVERQLIKQTKEVICNEIDWDCKVTTLFRDENLGCAEGVASAITWFFENVNEGIILEDDCIPNRTFLYLSEFCLKKHRMNKNVGMISGNNHTMIIPSIYKYTFSIHGKIWGWATWSDRWEKFSEIRKRNFLDIKSQIDLNFPELKHNKFLNKWLIEADTYHGTNETWDYDWGLTRYYFGWLTIRPLYNVVANVGFDEMATHTFSSDHKGYYHKTRNYVLNLRITPRVRPNRMRDVVLEKNFIKFQETVKIVFSRLYHFMFDRF